MAETAIDLKSFHSVASDGSHIVTVEISGLPDVAYANKVSNWMRDLIRANASQLGRLGTPAPRDPPLDRW